MQGGMAAAFTVAVNALLCVIKNSLKRAINPVGALPPNRRILRPSRRRTNGLHQSQRVVMKGIGHGVHRPHVISVALAVTIRMGETGGRPIDQNARR